MELSPQAELELLKEDIARERRQLERSERAKEERRLTDEKVWAATLARRRKHIEELECALAEALAAQRAADEAYEETL